MRIPRFAMEEWLIRYRFDVKYNLAESGVRDITVGRLLEYADQPIDVLGDIVLEDEDTRGTEPLRRLISQTYETVSAEDVLVTTGTSEALLVFFNTVLSPKDTVIVERPSFQALWQIPSAIPCDVRFLDLSYGQGFELNIDSLRRLVNEKTRLIIINTPHNPSGRIRTSDTIKEVLDIARNVGALLLVDEHYRFLPLDRPSPLPSAIDLGEPDILVTGSITKCFGMIGLRVGWLIGPQDILAECRDYRDYLTHVLSPVSDRLARLAIGASSVILNDNIEMIRENRSVLEKFIERHQDCLEWVKPEAGATAFPRLLSGENADDFVRQMVEEAGVFLLPGSSFNRPSHFRICLGVGNSAFREAIDHVDNAMSNRRSSNIA